MFLFSSIISLYWKHKPDDMSIAYMKLTFFVLWILKYKSVRKFSRSTPWWTPPSSAGKYMQIVHYKLKKIKLQNFLENITLVSKIVKIVSKAYGVGLTRKDTLGFFTNCFLFIFSELRFLESWFTQVFCHCRNWKQKRNTSLSKKEKEKLQFCNTGWQCVHRRSRGLFGGRKVKEEIGKIRELAFRHKFSLSFIQSFEKAFRCSICHVTSAKLPLIACQACSTLLGCESCTNTWYGNGFDKKCSKCNTPRGLSKTFMQNGFDNLIHQLELMNEGTLGNNDSSDTLPVSEE